MKTNLTQFEERIWNEWVEATERGETDLDYGDYFESAVKDHNDMLEDDWRSDG